jgi:hypothetical protein
MNHVWQLWHSLPAIGQAGIIGASVTAFVAGLFGVLHALIKDHPRIAAAYGTMLVLLFGGFGLALRLSYAPPPDPPSPFTAPKTLDADRWFVYVTTDQPGNLTTARQDATRLRARLERSKLSLPVHLYMKADKGRSAVGIGDAASEQEAQDMLNRVVAAGWSKAAKNKSLGWIQLE